MKHGDRDKGLSRREFQRLGVAALVAATGAPLLSRAARGDGHEDALVDSIPENQMLVTAIQYVNQSPKEGQQCSGCALYVAGGNGRGKCSLFQQGVVAETGWCTSWVPKPA